MFVAVAIHRHPADTSIKESGAPDIAPLLTGFPLMSLANASHDRGKNGSQKLGSNHTFAHLSQITAYEENTRLPSIRNNALTQ